MVTVPPSEAGEVAASLETQPAEPKDIPPIEEQVRTIEGLVKAFNNEPLDEGTAAYVVSRRWLAQAQALGSGDAARAAKEVPQGTLGPIDNSDIIDGIVQDVTGADAVRLKPGTSLEDFELFPKSAWDLLVSWYGLAAGQSPIERLAHDTATSSMIPNVQFELHPPVFTLHRLWSVISGIAHDKEVPDTTQPPPVILCSSSYNLQSFLRRAKTLLHIPMNRHVRLWRVPRKQPAAAPARPAATPAATAARSAPLLLSTPPDSPKLDAASGTADLDNPQDSWSRLLLEVTEFMKLENSSEREQLSQVKDLTHDENYNGRRTLAFVSLTVDQTLVLDENIDRNQWVSTYRPKGSHAAGKDKGTATSARPGQHGASASAAAAAAGASSSTAVTRVTTAASSGRSSPIGPVTRGRAKQKSGRVLGCVGLGNLGNTCYMNSALQCLRSVEELTKYFLVHENEVEINHSNPLGHGGNVANAYAYLLDEIYKDSAPSSISPRSFKTTVGRYAPAFSGYGQQDSQEFLGFLLDGLQEDLSRVKKKPYIEKPDSTDEMINNPAAIREMAEQVWDITKRRDDSIIADLFTGMYKSTLICPVCQKVSITFDPFTNLTLPLPIQNVWSKTVRFVPLNDRPVCLDVELDKTSSFRALKEFVGLRVGVPPERLVGVEELRDNIIKIYDDFMCVSEEITSSDIVVLFEVESAPTNLSASQAPRKKYRSMLQIDREPDLPPWDSPLANRLLVPVIHRFQPSEETGTRRRFGKSSLASPTHFIVLTPEEARSEDIIRRKILEKVASFTTWSEFAKAEESSTNGSASVSTSVSASASASHASSGSDADVVVTTASDAESAGDGKVIAKSVEGEDDLVDVTMNDAATAAAAAAAASRPKALCDFNRHRPKWVVDPKLFLLGELQNLFQMSYFDDHSNMLPIKWSGTTDEKDYPSLQSRIPVPKPPAPVDEEMESPGVWGSTNGSENGNTSSQEEEAAPAEATATSDVTRMVEESDEDEPMLPAQKKLAFRNAANKVGPGRRKAKPHKTYGKKGLKRRPRHLQPVAHSDTAQDPEDTEEDQASNEAGYASADAPKDAGPLVRLGEGIMVDWNQDAWDTVYGKDGPGDTFRGEPTFMEPYSVIEDTELQAKRRHRISRRKHGMTLDECLDEFEREEILSENDTWYCPRCKEHRRASKKFDLWKTPDILVVHLKRFSSSGWRRDKLDTRVDFPVEGLDLTKRVLDRQTGKQEIFDLIGVDDHWGGLGGGHYTAFAKNFVNGQWYEYNDSSVSKVSDPARVVSSSAYLLFYRRRSDGPLGGPRFQRIADKYNRSIPVSDEDMSDSASGEGQRLDIGSSQTGSSSALKGAGAGAAAGPRRPASLDLHSGGDASGAAADDGDYLPLYSAPSTTIPGAVANGVRGGSDMDSDEDDSGDLHDRLVGTTSVLNFGESSSGGLAGASGNDDAWIRRSVEMDDRVSGHAGSSWTQQSWSFGSLAQGGGGGDRSPGSDTAEVDELELATPGAAGQDDDSMSLGAADEGLPPPSPSSSSHPPPLLDLDNQANMEDIQQQMWARKAEAAQVHTVRLGGHGGADDDADSEKAVDIHLSEDETAKMDD